MRSWTAAEADAVLSRALAATLRAGYCLVDYEVHLLDVAHGAEGAQTSAVAAVVSVLRARRDDSAQAPPRRRHPASGSNEGWRTVVSVVEIPLGRPPPPPPRLLFSVEVPPAPPRTPHHAAASAGAAHAPRRRRGARAAGEPPARRARAGGRRAPRGRDASNAGAVATGMSAAALTPTQPVCVVGWNGIPIRSARSARSGGGRGR